MNESGSRKSEARGRLALRHKPRQDRSRARLQALLDAAAEVIAESGLQGLAMREVARRADLPIASVYHYFPSMAALVRALVERQLEKLRTVLKTGLQNRLPMDKSELDAEQVKLLIDDIAGFFFQTPSAPEIWASLHAYPDLRELNIEDTKSNAAILQPYLVHFFPVLAPEQATATAIVLIEWVSSAIRFAMGASPDVRASIVDALKTLVAQSLSGFAPPPSHAATAKRG
jgi:AcrR family transcriptional regulator